MNTKVQGTYKERAFSSQLKTGLTEKGKEGATKEEDLYDAFTQASSDADVEQYSDAQMQACKDD